MAKHLFLKESRGLTTNHDVAGQEQAGTSKILITRTSQLKLRR